MNFFKFLYDVFVWITSNYASMPDGFKSRFSEESCINGRLYLSDYVQSDSDFNIEFKEYE